MTAPTTPNNTSGRTIKKPLRPAFFNTGSLPWTPWVMDGSHFKLLNIDQKTGGFSMLLKVDAGNYAPVHGHLGAVEAYIVEGEFGYEDDGSIEGIVDGEMMLRLAREHGVADHLAHVEIA